MYADMFITGGSIPFSARPATTLCISYPYTYGCVCSTAYASVTTRMSFAWRKLHFPSCNFLCNFLWDFHEGNHCNFLHAKLIRVVTDVYAVLQTHPYTYGYDMQNVVACRVLKDMDPPVTNISAYIGMQLPLCKTHPCSYGCVCNAANTSVLLRIGLQHWKPIHSHTNGISTLITHPYTTNVKTPLITHP